MSLDNLPVEWMNVKISDITVKGEQRKPNDSEEFIYVDIGSINRDLKKIENPQFLLGKDAPSRARKVIKKGDVLVSLTRPNLNAVALVGENYDQQIASTGFEVISPMIVESKYLFSLVRTQHFINEISKQEQGALYPAAKSSDVQAYDFPLPPLAEQQEIVRQLDVMLAQVEQIKTRLDAIPAILKKFRQSVLADAVSGKLTEDWRSQNNIEDWKWETWFDITTKSKDAFKRGPFGSSLKKSMFVEQGFKVYEQYCPINDDCSYARYYITPEKFEEMKEFEVKDGDFLISCSGVSLGRITQVPLNSERGIINQALLRVRLDNSKYDSDFFKILFRSPTFQKVIFENSTGSAIPNLKAAKLLKQIPVPMPNLMEQENIVTRVYELYRSISLIEESVQSAQKRVNLLTQSILAKAFSGELTAEWREQHQELITGVNSAESLLAKIQAEREASKPVKKAKKVK
ncbi:restriction endonuclease subunit S [Acinetobacter indicus]|uniref:restriction endonuclease subunit S n=1 Tax=Acinetobacter indicus TaxID=756892 RepID=UPI00398A21BA